MPHPDLQRSLTDPDLHIGTGNESGPYGPDGFAIWSVPYETHWLNASSQGGPERLAGPGFIVRRIDAGTVDWMRFRLDGEPAGMEIFGTSQEGATLWDLLRVGVDEPRIQSL